MVLPGHLALAYLAGRVTRTDLRLAVGAGLFPDLVDKPLRWVLRLTPNGRVPAHTASAWALTTLLAGLWGGRRAALGWAAGYGAHLLGDQLNARHHPGQLYFWWPLRRYRLDVGSTGPAESLRDYSLTALAQEGAVTAIALLVWLWGRRRPGRMRKG